MQQKKKVKEKSFISDFKYEYPFMVYLPDELNEEKISNGFEQHKNYLHTVHELIQNTMQTIFPVHVFKILSVFVIDPIYGISPIHGMVLDNKHMIDRIFKDWQN